MDVAEQERVQPTQLGLAVQRLRDELGVDPQASVARFGSAF